MGKTTMYSRPGRTVYTVSIRPRSRKPLRRNLDRRRHDTHVPNVKHAQPMHHRTPHTQTSGWADECDLRHATRALSLSPRAVCAGQGLDDARVQDRELSAQQRSLGRAVRAG